MNATLLARITLKDGFGNMSVVAAFGLKAVYCPRDAVRAERIAFMPITQEERT